MFLKISTRKATGRTQLSIVEGYYDKQARTSRTRTIQTLGYLDVLEKEFDDPITHFKEVARQMTEEQKASKAPVILEIDPKVVLPVGTDNRKNFGHLAVSALYHDLEIQEFFANRQRQTGAKYNLNAIFRALVYLRIISPGSKKSSFEDMKLLFDKCDFSLDDVYRSLDIFSRYQADLQLFLHQKLTKNYGRDTSLVYYDVTNFYFEIDEEDEMKRRGVSKEHRPDPIVQMGLFMDTNGLPITFGLFSGNTLDKQTLIPMMGRLVDDYDLERIIVVADRGMITGDNISQTLLDGNGYVLSLSIRGGTKDLKEYVLNEKGYRMAEGETEGFKIKSKQIDRKIHVTNPLTGKKKDALAEEKLVVFYSPDYARKTKYERDLVLEKSRDLIAHPDKYSRATGYGAAKYVKNAVFDKETGEIIRKKGSELSLDEELIREEELYDGYYAIVTSEYEKTDREILDIYRGLWKIEENFGITKSGLESRPVYVKTIEHVKAHFLICFTALLLMKLMEYRIKRKYSVKTILESLRKCGCSHLEQNYYLFDYYDEVLKELGNDLKIDFNRKYRSLGEIREALGKTKKPGLLKDSHVQSTPPAQKEGRASAKAEASS